MTTIQREAGASKAFDLGRAERVDALVAAAARRDPGALAVAAPDASLTYDELLRGADAVAGRLRSLGVGEEELVGLCLPRSAALMVAALGILRAGATYVALDPSVPPDRLDQMLTDSGVRVVISAEGVAEVRGGGPTSASTPEAPGRAGGSPLAYVVYTSGSTGSPKGVLVEHAGLMNLVAWHQRAFEITAADRGTQVASPGFDAAAWEIWPYLAAGASVHVPPVTVRADPQALRDWLVAEAITVSFLPTALAEQVSLLPWPSAALRLVLTGGDRLRQGPPEGLPFRLVNNYGLSEATVVSTSGVVPPGTSGAPTIGAAIDGVRLAVVDGDQQAVPAGDAGELMVGGVSVARGYLNQPELTRRRFVTPVWAEPGERWYRTGDLVRLRPDGEVEFLGRLDDQVQVRGVRIEPGEVSARLDRHPDVRASVVIAVGEGADERRLYAYLVPRDDDARKPSRQELQDYLGTHLPDYMIPAGFGWVREFSSTENGKVDRSALPPPVFTDATPAEEIAPASDLEEVVAAIVAERLGLERVAPEDNFFLLGGHSLLGAQLITRVSDQFGVSLDLRALFDNPTSRGLAAEVERLILEETESLTDEEAARLLDELDGRRGTPADGSRP